MQSMSFRGNAGVQVGRGNLIELYVAKREAVA